MSDAAAAIERIELERAKAMGMMQEAAQQAESRSTELCAELELVRKREKVSADEAKLRGEEAEAARAEILVSSYSYVSRCIHPSA